ncbi:MAG: D-glucuronyl C5-epimerase family protein [candidate division KSB1 bacterium]|nr:D-glucuronyl C5-epimerase family protein [candidate division KSB1 bacterium]
MLKKLHKDLTRDRQIYHLADDMHSPDLRDYYFIMTEEQMRSGHSQDFHFDEKGIPIIPTYIDIEERELIYYPISIGQYGLAIWHSFLRNSNDENRRRFLKIADWFLSNCIEDPELGAYWLTHVDKPAYQISKPWKSAFSQARAINILLRAYQLTGNKDYEKCATLALQPFTYSVEEGGVAQIMPDGAFYEEYPSHVPVLVLNGMIFALCGIQDFLRLHPEHNLAARIMDDGVKALINLLPSYDMGFWSKYALCEADFHPKVDPATIGYHHLHIIQLELMHRLTKNDIFPEYARKWRAYVNKRNILKMYSVKYKALRTMRRL